MKFSILALLVLPSIGCEAFQPNSISANSIRHNSPRRFTVSLRDATLEEPTTSTAETTEKSLTQRIMEKTNDSQSSGAGGSSTYDAFLRAETNWARLKDMEAFDYDEKLLGTRQDNFITDDAAQGSPRAWATLREIANGKKELDYDVVVCGGTLGIFFATSLLLRNPNLKIAVVEAGKLQGRAQEWNISRSEMEELVELGVLSEEDVKAVITTEFPGCRSGFKNREVTPLEGGYFENDVGYECFTPQVLNLGVAPQILLERVTQRFRGIGGTVLEQTRLQGICVSETIGGALDIGEDSDVLTSRLVLDCMGNASPISRQQRIGMKPDGVCAVVGSCASGFDAKTNLVGDIIYTNSEIMDVGGASKNQYFWEAFPVGIGAEGGLKPGESDVKTTYMFTYMDAEKERPSLSALMDDYWKLLPIYQNSITDPEKDLDFRRVLFAFFPTYRDSPLKPKWSRVLAVGDASGIQSPLSFGGFGALTRHLERITDALSDALEDDLLHKDDLGKINAYTPNLSAAWMFQKAMSVKTGQRVNPKFVNRLLAVNFEVMENMGERTMKPFLQDVVRLDGLAGSLARSFAADPLFMPEIVAHVGLPRLVDWLGHVSMIALYTLLDNAASPLLGTIAEQTKDPRQRFALKRQMEAWKFGSGGDYKF